MVFTLLEATVVMLGDNALESWRLGVGFVLVNPLRTAKEIGIHHQDLATISLERSVFEEMASLGVRCEQKHNDKRETSG